MRKLTVKNFSVIKEAELEFGKITVLIGPQSSGKSLLCKLAYFLGKEVLEQAVKSIVDESPLDEFKKNLVVIFLSRYSTNGWLRTSSRAQFVAGTYRVTVSGVGDPVNPDISVDFSADFESLYAYFLGSQPYRERIIGKSRQDRQDEVWTKLNLLLTAPFVYESLYVPAGRAFFTDASKGFSALQNTDIDPLVRQFASEISWNTRWRVGSLVAANSALEDVKKTMDKMAGGTVYFANNVPAFLTWEGWHLPLGLLSSGTQELLPLFNVLDRLASSQEHREVSRTAARIPPYDQPPVGTKKLLYLEEPEASVFPSTQYELVRLFALLSHQQSLDFSWVITTHSPYVLSSFNNLIYAGQLGENEALRGEISIPEKYWIKRGDFAAYKIRDDRVLESILSDSGLIDGEYLDSVSENIGDEFDKLLRLEYDHNEAS